MSASTKRVSGSLGSWEDVKRFLDQLEEAGCDVTHDRDAGAVQALDEGVAVFRALLKDNAIHVNGSSGVWLLMFRDSDRIQWSRQ